MEDYIDLDRRFLPYRDATDVEKGAQESYLAGFVDTAQTATWDDLLTRPRVVLLGEPGSGKSYELRARTRALAEAGKPSFFLDLRRLVTESVETILGEDGSQSFAAWQRGNEIGYFFLDAVDEAKLRIPKDFYQALDRFANDLGLSALARAHVVLSSRISEWHPFSDRLETRARLSFPGPIPDANEVEDSDKTVLDWDPPVVVQMAALDRDQVAAFAQHCGIPDTSAFRDALDCHNAWAFARRPLDVRGLAHFWRKNGRLGSLRELIEHELDHHLKERPDRPDPLTPEQARKGAEWLAAACVLCRETSIQVPDERHDNSSDALEAPDSLPSNWEPGWVRALLQRGIFDAAAYGRIRFHHRRITEYLAAQWLSARMKDGRDVPSLVDLLFTEVDGGLVLRPSLAPTTAWLLLGKEPWRLELRSLVLHLAPGLLLQHGDPKELPLSHKRDALRKLAERYRDRERVWLSVDTDTLSRISEPGLAETVSEILQDNSLPEDFRIEMLRLVRYGGLEDCVGGCLAIISDPAASASIKSHAAASVRDAGTRDHKIRLAEISAEMDSIPSVFCAHICEAIFPEVAGAPALISILRKVQEVPKFSVDLPYYLRQHLKSLNGAYDAERLLAGLTELGKTEPWIEFNGEQKRFSARYFWVGEPMAQALKDLLSRENIGDESASVAADSIPLLGQIHQHPEVHLKVPEDLQERLAYHWQVRRRYIWNRICERRDQGKTDEPWLHQLFDYGSPLTEDARDLDWLIADIAEARKPEDRKAALHLALQYWTNNKRRWRVLRQMWRATAGQPSLRQDLVRCREVRPWRPLVLFWYRKVHHKLFYGARRVQWHFALRRAFSRLRDKAWLFRHLRGLYSGKLTYQISRLASEAHSPDGSRDRWAATDWTALAKERGWVVAFATRHGCKAAWASFVPSLPCEEPPGSGTDHQIIVGLSGLESLWSEQELDFARMSDREAETAARYAFRELNDFPRWFPALVDHWPEVVRRVIRTAIEETWQTPAEQEQAGEEIERLGYHGEYVIPLVEPDLLDRIRDSDPPNIRILVQVLSILAKLPSIPRQDLATVALERMRVDPTDIPRTVVWLSLGLQTDAARTLNFLEQVLPETKCPRELIERLCAALDNQHRWRNEGPLLTQPDFQLPRHLRRLIPIVYGHIRAEDDLDRSNGGTYSPTSRDGAQNFRNGLLVRLASQDDPAALNLLRELLEEPRLEREREWIRHLIDQHVDLLAERPPWTAKTLHEYAADFEYAPRTSYELFRLSLSRFEQIRRSVEAADVSARDDLRKGDDEARLRSWLRRQLVSLCRDRYSVPQEEEIDREKRPDLQIEVPGLPPLPVEIKWADRWTVTQLLERLENQLFGDYLRSYENRYGIFLIGYHGEKGYWSYPTNRGRLDLNSLRQLLQSRADHLASNRDDVDAVRVISIDFTRPD